MPTDSRNQRSWATRITAASTLDQVRLEPLERADVEMVGRLVEQQQVGLGRQRPGKRGAGELAAGERRERAVELGVDEAETAQRDVDPVAPAVAARMLEASLGVGVGVERRLVGGPAAIAPRARDSSASISPIQRGRPRTYSRRVAPAARRALIVQSDPHALAEHDLAGVGPDLAGEHPQQGRLAAAVAAGERHALAAVELERESVNRVRSPMCLARPAAVMTGMCGPAGSRPRRACSAASS